MNNLKLPVRCPSCSSSLHVVKLGCEACNTAVEGGFNLPALARLSADDQEFLLNFLTTSGSLKEIAKTYAVSYPTVRNRLDALIERVKALQESSS